MDVSMAAILTHGQPPQWRMKKVACRYDCLIQHFSAETLDGSMGIIGSLEDIVVFSESLKHAAVRQMEIAAMMPSQFSSLTDD